VAGEAFTVDLGWLETVVGKLANATEVTGTVLKALEETGPTRMGHGDLDSACDEFHDNWDERIKRFSSDIKAAGEAVGAAKRDYGATEQAAAQRVGSRILELMN
jgi:hypothetical protein